MASFQNDVIGKNPVYIHGKRLYEYFTQSNLILLGLENFSQHHLWNLVEPFEVLHWYGRKAVRKIAERLALAVIDDLESERTSIVTTTEHVERWRRNLRMFAELSKLPAEQHNSDTRYAMDLMQLSIRESAIFWQIRRDEEAIEKAIELEKQLKQEERRRKAEVTEAVEREKRLRQLERRRKAEAEVLKAIERELRLRQEEEERRRKAEAGALEAVERQSRLRQEEERRRKAEAKEALEREKRLKDEEYRRKKEASEARFAKTVARLRAADEVYHALLVRMSQWETSTYSSRRASRNYARREVTPPLSPPSTASQPNSHSLTGARKAANKTCSGHQRCLSSDSTPPDSPLWDSRAIDMPCESTPIIRRTRSPLLSQHARRPSQEPRATMAKPLPSHPSQEPQPTHPSREPTSSSSKRWPRASTPYPLRPASPDSVASPEPTEWSQIPIPRESTPIRQARQSIHPELSQQGADSHQDHHRPSSTKEKTHISRRENSGHDNISPPSAPSFGPYICDSAPSKKPKMKAPLQSPIHLKEVMRFPEPVEKDDVFSVPAIRPNLFYRPSSRKYRR